MSGEKKRRLEHSDELATGHLESIATYISLALKKDPDVELLSPCGSAVITILETQPDIVLELAHEKLHAWPYHAVPVCWRRLYEDASLHKAAMLLRSHKEAASGKRQRSVAPCCKIDSVATDLLSQVVGVLDMGTALSGQPYRQELYQDVFERLQCCSDSVHIGNDLPSFSIMEPPALATSHAVTKLVCPMFEEFQQHLDMANTPLAMTGVLGEWAALTRWTTPSYLFNQTLGGRRLVPVEIGESYTAEHWTQRIMTFREYIESFVLPTTPSQIGYLAQHDLLSQIPSLKKDIRVPDYCYTDPPPAPATVSKKAAQLQEPQLNAWLGPNGTRSPLHTDPYCNIFSQVVGYKYIRLYAPEQTTNLYPRGTDESGVDMSNTSQIELSFASRDEYSCDGYPLFAKAEFKDIILGPGECLYIPAGWWHFIESLSISFSVSFWWS